MKRIRAFDYHEPPSIDEAIQILAAAGDGAQVLAGGTDLIVDMKTGRSRPSTVVNLKRVAGLNTIEAASGGTRVGALTKVTAIESSSLVRDRHPALAQAASLLASPPVRALATIGGNVGRASPASDLGPALIALGAIAAIEGEGGGRNEPVEDLYAGPGETTMASSDVITSFLLPDPEPGAGSAHVKLGKRGSGTDIAKAGASVSVVVDERGEIDDCRIALASVGPTPLRAVDAEAVLRSTVPSEAGIAASADSAANAARPISDVRASASYRKTLVRVLTLRALREAIQMTGAEVTP